MIVLLLFLNFVVAFSNVAENPGFGASTTQHIMRANFYLLHGVVACVTLDYRLRALFRRFVFDETTYISAEFERGSVHSYYALAHFVAACLEMRFVSLCELHGSTCSTYTDEATRRAVRLAYFQSIFFPVERMEGAMPTERPASQSGCAATSRCRMGDCNATPT